MYVQHVEDPYQARTKFPGSTVCPDCGAVFQQGRWQWSDAPDDAQTHRCPACRRIQEHVPAGVLTLSGEFLAAHRDEIMHLVRNMEEREKSSRPLERIMDIDEASPDGGVVIAFTGLHLAKGTGEALRHAYRGEFHYNYTDRDGVLHAQWQR